MAPCGLFDVPCDEPRSAVRGGALRLYLEPQFRGPREPRRAANYLASPPLVVAHAIAGTVTKDLETEPLGHNKKGEAVYLRDIWPSAEEINAFAAKYFFISRLTSSSLRLDQIAIPDIRILQLLI